MSNSSDRMFEYAGPIAAPDKICARQFCGCGGADVLWMSFVLSMWFCSHQAFFSDESKMISFTRPANASQICAFPH